MEEQLQLSQGNPVEQRELSEAHEKASMAANVTYEETAIFDEDGLNQKEFYVSIRGAVCWHGYQNWYPRVLKKCTGLRRWAVQLFRVVTYLKPGFEAPVTRSPLCFRRANPSNSKQKLDRLDSCCKGQTQEGNGKACQANTSLHCFSVLEKKILELQEAT